MIFILKIYRIELPLLYGLRYLQMSVQTDNTYIWYKHSTKELDITNHEKKDIENSLNNFLNFVNKNLLFHLKNMFLPNKSLIRFSTVF